MKEKEKGVEEVGGEKEEMEKKEKRVKEEGK